MINKRWITLSVVYSRPFTSKAVFWAILKEFEFAVDCSIYITIGYTDTLCGHPVAGQHDMNAFQIRELLWLFINWTSLASLLKNYEAQNQLITLKPTCKGTHVGRKELEMKITTITHLEDYESLTTKTIGTASMIQASNTSRRVIIRFPMLTLKTMTDNVSSIMLHTG